MDFRKWITVLFALTLFAGFACAQQNEALQCTATGGVTPQIRAESYTDLMGDIVITCRGGAQLPNGAPVPQANIVVQVSAPVTSRLQGSDRLSEALLLVDEPQSGLAVPLGATGYGSEAPQVYCTTPASGCAATVRTLPTGFNVAVSSGTVAAANVFQGYVASDNRTVTFFGVPILPPASNGTFRTLRITNVRINGNAVGGGQFFGGAQVSAYVSTNASTSLPLSYPAQVITGFVLNSLSTSVKTSSANPYLQCKNLGVNSNGDVIGDFSTTQKTATITFKELFGTAFKTRVVPLSTSTTAGIVTNLTPAPAGSLSAQSVPGGVYTGYGLSNSESGLIAPLSGSFNAGLADFGTRLKAVFTNIPDGVSVWVDVNQASGTTANVRAVAIDSESVDEITALPSGSQKKLTVTGGSATAVWEIVAANPNQLDTVNFDVYVGYKSDTANGKPLAPTVSNVAMQYAPTSTVGIPSTTAKIPRFADINPTPAPFFKIVICQTALLWPYVAVFPTSDPGFDTGLAIANTSKDPFKDVMANAATGEQSGDCSLYFYGSDAVGTFDALLPGCNQANAITGRCVPTIAAGKIWSGIASRLQPSAKGFAGYVIGVCNFQYAHGYGAITDIGSRNFVSSYLALVFASGPLDPIRGVPGEDLEN